MSLSDFALKAGISRQTLNNWLERGFLTRKYDEKTPYLTGKDFGLVPEIRKLLKTNQHRL